MNEQRDQGVKCLEVKMRGKSYYHCKLEQLLQKVELNCKLTPVDLLFKYGKVYHVNLKDHSMITEVPKKVRDLEEKLGLNIFPI